MFKNKEKKLLATVSEEELTDLVNTQMDIQATSEIIEELIKKERNRTKSKECGLKKWLINTDSTIQKVVALIPEREK